MKIYLLYSALLFCFFWIMMFYIEFGNCCGNKKKKDDPLDSDQQRVSKEIRKFLETKHG